MDAQLLGRHLHQMFELFESGQLADESHDGGQIGRRGGTDAKGCRLGHWRIVLASYRGLA